MFSHLPDYSVAQCFEHFRPYQSLEGRSYLIIFSLSLTRLMPLLIIAAYTLCFALLTHKLSVRFCSPKQSLQLFYLISRPSLLAITLFVFYRDVSQDFLSPPVPLLISDYVICYAQIISISTQSFLCRHYYAEGNSSPANRQTCFPWVLSKQSITTRKENTEI